MEIARWRQEQASKLCRYCKSRGIPLLRAGLREVYYGHSIVQANGCSEMEICEANSFLRNLDKFARIEGEEWKKITTKETGSPS